jgi:Na+-transporting NADH:ubiquinone oxidoreductase subunit NqrE
MKMWDGECLLRGTDCGLTWVFEVLIFSETTENLPFADVTQLVQGYVEAKLIKLCVYFYLNGYERKL